ncbi:hypothetical protein JTB14_036613 [Gonioctena quinquepunctata]|nr:hypothetical protein JTB14_036613 [Gonioctena quinquepunctata]
MAALAAGVGAGLAYIGCVLCCNGIEKCQREKEAHQQDDIYNISSRVQAQEQWPTHDAHLSIDHITIMDQMNKPPSYNDDLPPSYEEAMRIATLNSLGETSNPTVIVEPPRPTNTN